MLTAVEFDAAELVGALELARVLLPVAVLLLKSVLLPVEALLLLSVLFALAEGVAEAVLLE